MANIWRRTHLGSDESRIIINKHCMNPDCKFITLTAHVDDLEDATNSDCDVVWLNESEGEKLEKAISMVK